METSNIKMGNESSPSVEIMKAALAFIVVGAIIYIVPEPIDYYIAFVYAVLVNFVTLACCLSLVVLSTKKDDPTISKTISKTVESKIKANDLFFFKRILSSRTRKTMTLISSALTLTFGIFLGNIVESTYVYYSLIAWSLVYFLSRDRVESLMAENHRDMIVEHINKQLEP